MEARAESGPLTPPSSNTIDTALARYAEAYEKLYQRPPRDLRALNDRWVVVNGAQMGLNELEYLTTRLMDEYEKQVAQKRSIVTRLLKWFKSN